MLATNTVIQDLNTYKNSFILDSNGRLMYLADWTLESLIKRRLFRKSVVQLRVTALLIGSPRHEKLNQWGIVTNPYEIERFIDLLPKRRVRFLLLEEQLKLFGYDIIKTDEIKR